MTDLVLLYSTISTDEGSDPGISTYVGPGDIFPSANFWVGLRAYARSTAGNKCINLRRDSDQATQDFNTLATGVIDLASITTFKGSANLFVTRLYDQTGNGFDYAQTTAANQPAFTLNALGTNPGITFTKSTSLAMQGVINIQVSAQPFTISAVALTNNVNGYGTVLGQNTGPMVGGFLVAPPAFFHMNAGTDVATVSASTGTFYAIQYVFNGASSDCNVNGSTNTINPGTGAWATADRSWLSNLGNYLDGIMMEVGGWASAFAAGTSASMSSNQRSQWGF